VDDSLRYDIVVVGNDGIEVMLWLKGENEKYLYPEISPSGQKIAFTQTPGMVCIVGFGEYKDDFPMRCYVSDLGVPLKPKWSSDGNYIAYLIYHPDHVGLNMQVMSSDGLYHTTVVDNWMVDIDYGDIEWAP
jgi:tricorn protease-like protein